MEIFLADIMAEEHLRYKHARTETNINGEVSYITTNIYEKGKYIVEERVTTEPTNKITDKITLVFKNDMLHCKWGPAYEHIIEYKNADGGPVTMVTDEYYIHGQSQTKYNPLPGDELIWQ